MAPKEDKPHIHQEFTNGNWVLNNNKDVSFCAVGGHNALEHLNRSIKVSRGLVAVTLNASAQTNFFLIVRYLRPNGLLFPKVVFSLYFVRPH